MTQYPLRVPDHIMAQAKVAASEDNVSVNQMLLSFIAEGLGHRRGLRMIQERGRRADIGAALAILEKVPDVPAGADDMAPDARGASKSGR